MSLFRFRHLAGALLLTINFSALVQAQQFNASIFEISGFAGGGFFKRVEAGNGSRLTTGPVVGGRLSENPWEHFGFEQSVGYGWHSFEFLRTVPGVVTMQPFDTRELTFDVGPVYYFTRRGSRWRPFLTVAGGGIRFSPTKDAQTFFQQNGVKGADHLREETRWLLAYGGGLKYRFNDALGMRGDVRGLMARNPTWGLPTQTSCCAYVPNGNWINGMEATLGLVLNFGGRRATTATNNPPTDNPASAVPPAPATPVPAPTPEPKPEVPPAKPPRQITLGPIRGAAAPVCFGQAVNISADATDSENRTLAYRWAVNGQPAGPNANAFAFTPPAPGTYRIDLTASDAQDAAVPIQAQTITITARDCTAPAAVCAVSAPEVNAGTNPTFAVTATVAQGNTPRIVWTVSEGRLLSPNVATTAFDSGSVNFPPSAATQTKTITATATVTDDSGATASCNTTVRVVKRALPVHYGDIVFAQGSARVNNCAKRILYERVYPELTGAYLGYTLVLVGHIDPSEPEAQRLDQRRVMNTAASLSANRDTCKALEPGRIRADWVGTTVTEYKETPCGVSFEAAPAERARDRVNPSDARARNRRVEIWLVPAGEPMPPSVKEARTLPTDELRRLACPR